MPNLTEHIRDIKIGDTTIKEFDILDIKDYEEDQKGLTVTYYNGKTLKINGSQSAIEILKLICDTSIMNQERLF